jgi:hypothetical protein
MGSEASLLKIVSNGHSPIERLSFRATFDHPRSTEQEHR